MAYVVPGTMDFRSKFPTFPEVEGARLASAIDEAVAEVPNTWRETDYEPAILYLAAHLLLVDGAFVQATPPGAIDTSDMASRVTDIKVGDVNVKFGSGGNAGSTASASSRAGYSATVYGQRFAIIRARNTATARGFLRA